MSALYRRGPPSQRDDLGAAAVSILVGGSVAAVTFYLTRLYLSRERLQPENDGDRTPRLTAGDAGRLPVGGTPSPSDD